MTEGNRGKDPMRIATLALGASLAVVLVGDGAAQSFQDQIQNEEAPGSEIQMNIGGGWLQIGRQRNFDPSSLMIQGQDLDVPDDPDTPYAEDAVDAELPGEGPEDLSGPDDDDSLPD
jgi:hypothetical protein